MNLEPDKPKILVVICALNEAKNIERCVRSLMSSISDANVNAEFKVVISDNSSDDGTPEISKRLCELYPGLVYQSIVRCSLSVSRNSFMFYQSDFVAYLDADGYVSSTWAAELYHSITEKCFDVLSGPVFDINAPNILFDAFYSYLWLEPNYIIGANMVFKRLALDEVDGFSDIFDSRGDETILFEKAKLRELDWVYCYNENLLAGNTFPKKIINFLKTLILDSQSKVIMDNSLSRFTRLKLQLMRAFRVFVFWLSLFLLFANVTMIPIIVFVLFKIYLKNELKLLKKSKNLSIIPLMFMRIIFKVIIDISYCFYSISEKRGIANLIDVNLVTPQIREIYEVTVT